MIQTTHEKPAPAHRPAPRPTVVKLSLNWRLLLVSVMVLAVVVAVGYVRYHWQRDRSAAAMLDRAAELEKREQWLEAASYLFRYTQVRPDDPSVWARLATDYGKAAETNPRQRQRAIEFHHRALGYLKTADDAASRQTRTELTAGLAELLLSVGMASEAEKEVEPWNPDGKPAEFLTAPRGKAYLEVMARSAYAKALTGGTQSKTEAIAALQRALRVMPGDVKLARYAAGLYRDRQVQLPREGQPDGRQPLSMPQREQAADQIMDAAVGAEENRNNPSAYFARYQYRRAYRLPGAEADLQKAVELGPDEFDILVAAGWAALASSPSSAQPAETAGLDDRLPRAGKLFERAIEIQPTSGDGYLGLGQVRLQQGQREQACRVWRQGITDSTGSKIELYRRLALALIRNQQFDDARTVINDQLQPEIDRYVVRRGVSDRSAALLRARVDLLNAEMLLAQRLPAKAIGEETKVAGKAQSGVEAVLAVCRGMPDSPQKIAVQVDALDLLARARASMTKWREAAMAYQQLLERMPSSPQYAQLAIRMWRLAGHPEMAGRLYESVRRQLQTSPSTSPAEWLWLAEATLDQQLRRPVGQRDWTDYQAAFERAVRHLDRASQWQAQLLAARQVLASGTADARDEAARLLAKAEAQAPDNPQLWSQLTLRYQQLGRPEDADRCLARYVQLAPKPLAQRLLQCQLLTMRRQLPEARQVLDQARAQAGDDQREAVLREAVRVDAAASDMAAAKHDLEQLHQLAPQDLEVVRPLAELALRAGDMAAARQWEEQLKTIEGDDGIWWRYFRARRLLASTSADQADRAHRAKEVANLQQEIESIQPTWPSGVLLKAELLARQNRVSDAIGAYQRAIDLGANGVSVYERLIRLLVQVGKLKQADAYLARLQSLASAPGALSESANSLSVSLAAQLDQPSEALRRARQWVKDQPDDATARIWLGHVLALNGKDDDAERVLSEATRRAEKDVRTWNALFTFYVTRDKPAAQRTLKAMAAKAGLSEPEQALVLGRGYELLQQPDQAKQAYGKAIELNPKNVEPRLRLASLLAVSDVAAAEKELQQALQQQPDSVAARRMLAMLRASQSTGQAWREVQQVLGTGGLGGTAADANRRWQARLLARVGGTQNLAKARETLESLVLSNPQAAPEDRILLARVYEAEGQTDTANEQYRALVDVPTPTPVHLAIYLDFLLRRNRVKDQAVIEKSLRQLDRLTVDGLWEQRLVYVSLDARRLSQAGAPDKVAALVDRFVQAHEPTLETDRQKTQMYARIARLYTGLRMPEQAEPWLRKAMALAPEMYTALAGTLAALSRHEEAIQLCLDHKPQPLTSQFMTTVMMVLSSNNPPQDAMVKVEPLLSQALTDGRDDAAMLFTLATIRAIQQQYEQSLELFTRANQLRPKHVLTLNNLATLLAEMPGREDEAMQYISEAIGIAGEQPFLLDTKGIILIRLGQTQQAVEALQQAVVGSTVDPRFYLHLAVALNQSGNRDEARKALEDALSSGLEATILTGSDRTWLDQLRRRLLGA